MKHLKIYKELSEPEIGDYVICNWRNADDEHEANIFIRNNIGQIINIIKYSMNSHIIRYDNIPADLHMYTAASDSTAFRLARQDILKFSKNREELEMYINLNKFNI